MWSRSPSSMSPKSMGLKARAIWFGCGVLLVQVTMFVCLIDMFSEAQKTAEKLAYSHRILASCALLSSYFDDALHCVILALALHDNRAAKRFEMVSENIPVVIAEMKTESAATAEDQADIETLSRTAGFVLDKMDHVYKEYSAGSHSGNEAVVWLNNFRLTVYPYLGDFMAMERKFSERHQKLRSNYSAKSDPATLLGGILLIVLVSNVALAVGSIVIFGQQVVRRLDVIADNFLRFSKHEELLPRQSGADEIGRLDAGFHELCRSLQEASDKEEAIFANMPVGLVSCNGEGVIERFNRTAGLLGNCQIGQAIKELFVSGATGIEELLTGNRIGPCRLAMRSTSGAIVPCEVTVARFLHNDEQKLLFGFLDISDREQIEKLREDFMNIVSHDIRSPLSSLNVCFDMLADGVLGDLNETGEKYVRSGQTQIDRVMKLTQDLLNMARLESGEIQLVKTKCTVGKLMQVAVDAVSSAAEKQGIKISIAPSELVVMADEDRVIQILLNFLSNAVKYTAPGKEISVFANELPGAVRIGVQDQGPGVPEHLCETIFERFKQVQKDDERRGTGLGLAICKLLAQSHGGTVGVTSSMGSGSVFWLELPVESAE